MPLRGHWQPARGCRRRAAVVLGVAYNSCLPTLLPSSLGLGARFYPLMIMVWSLTRLRKGRDRRLVASVREPGCRCEWCPDEFARADEVSPGGLPGLAARSPCAQAPRLFPLLTCRRSWLACSSSYHSRLTQLATEMPEITQKTTVPVSSPLTTTSCTLATRPTYRRSAAETADAIERSPRNLVLICKSSLLI